MVCCRGFFGDGAKTATFLSYVQTGQKLVELVQFQFIRLNRRFSVFACFFRIFGFLKNQTALGLSSQPNRSDWPVRSGF